MTLSDIAESAGTLAVHAAQVSSGPVPPDAALLYDYVSLSRQRLKLWTEAFRERRSGAGNSKAWIELADEVLVVELQTRVSVAVLAAADAHRQIRHAGPFARSVYLDQLQARQAVLAPLVSEVAPLGAAMRINRTRRRMERWADFLLALLQPEEVVSEFAADRRRSAEFRATASSVLKRDAHVLTLAALRNAAPGDPISCEKRERIHALVAKLLFSLLPPSTYHSDARPRSPSMHQFFDLTLLSDRAARRAVKSRLHRFDSAHPVDFRIVSQRYRRSDRPDAD